MKFHPLCEAFPVMSDSELDRLGADIKANGLQYPVLLLDDKILDGRNRWLACQKVGVKAETKNFVGDAFALVRSLNIERRHLGESQRGMVAAKLSTMKVGDNQHSGSANLHSISLQQAADEVNVSRRTVADAKLILTEAPQEEVASIERGEKTINEVKRKLKEAKREKKRKANAAKVATVAPLEALGLFSTIIIDPPWDWGDEGDVNQMGRAKPDYSTLSLDDLMKRPVGKLADSDCHLYMWITNRSLPKGFGLIEAWGFRYVTTLTWCKPSFGMGNYFRGQTEHVLFAVKGSLPLLRKDVGTWFMEKRPKGHSSKPDAFYELVKSCSPGPILDIFGRKERQGITTWGENSL